MRSFLSKFLTTGLLTGAGLYTFSKAYATPPQQNIFDESKLSNYFRNYIKDNSLQLPFFSHKYQSTGPYPSFLEGTILKDMNGLDYYNIYLDQAYQDALIGKSKLSEEEKTQMDDKAKLYCIFVPNDNVQNQYGKVHTGFISTLYDSLGAYLTLLAAGFVPPVTAYLNVRYHKAMEVGKEYVSIIEINELKGRKIFVNAKISDKEGAVYSSMESLYVKTKFDSPIFKEIVKVWSGLREKQLSVMLDKGEKESISKGNLLF